jgi:hypothetical protein
MSGWPALERFLRSEPHDVGMRQATEVLHVYVDLVAEVRLAEAARRRRAPECPPAAR